MEGLDEKRERWRPMKYNKETFIDKVKEYIAMKQQEGRPITKMNFCMYADIFPDYISEHNTKDDSEHDFSEGISILQMACADSYEMMALERKVEPRTAHLALRNFHGWVDNKDITSGGDKISTWAVVNIIKPDA